jgi:predicted O-methyltransferase YrrM
MASVTLMKLRQVVASRGVLGGATQVFRRVAHFLQAWKTVRKTGRISDPGQLLDVLFSPRMQFVWPLQSRWELDRLVEMVGQLRPARVAEIGTANGGTLFIWPHLATDDARIASIDLPGGAFGGGYPTWKAPMYRSFALPGQEIQLIRADSHADSTRTLLERWLDGQRLDFLFIDGDHSYEGVKQDFEMYAPLVRPGGLVALHDVAVHPPKMQCHVDQLWKELRARYAETYEFIEPPDRGRYGIGVVRIPQSSPQ